jgi:hypothetical protein
VVEDLLGGAAVRNVGLQLRTSSGFWLSIDGKAFAEIEAQRDAQSPESA